MARIIYVEDDEVVGEHVSTILIEAGHAIGVVSDGETALKVIKDRQPDLLILDAGLPGIGGVEVLNRLRRDPVLYGIPVLMLTGRRSEADEAIARQSGANDYLRKPFDPDELVVVVESILERNEQQTSRPDLRRSI